MHRYGHEYVYSALNLGGEVHNERSFPDALSPRWSFHCQPCITYQDIPELHDDDDHFLYAANVVLILPHNDLSIVITSPFNKITFYINSTK